MIRHLSLMLLKRDDKLLLGLKKRGFGMGKLNGTGGKVEPNESYEAGAIRETLEEVGIRVNNCTKVGQIIFKDLYFKGAPETDIMHVYLSEDFSGEAVETDEIKPQWYSLDKLPYDQMWSDDEYWLPQVLDGKKIDAFFHFNEQNVFTTYQVNIVPDKLIAEFSDSIFGLPEDGDKTKFVTRTAARAVLLDQNNRVALINA